MRTLIVTAAIALCAPPALAADHDAAAALSLAKAQQKQIQELEKRVVALEQKAFGLGTAKAAAPTCPCGPGCACEAGACPGACPKATAPAPAYARSDAAADYYHHAGQLWRVPAGRAGVFPDGATVPARPRAALGSCAGGSCSAGYQFPPNVSAGQAFQFYGGCAGGDCGR